MKVMLVASENWEMLHNLKSLRSILASAVANGHVNGHGHVNSDHVNARHS